MEGSGKKLPKKNGNAARRSFIQCHESDRTKALLPQQFRRMKWI